MPESLAAAARRGYVAGVLLLAIAIGGCTLSPFASNKPSSGGTPDAGVSTALAAMYDNRYTDAEKAFKALIAASLRSVEGHAYYALFLTYNHRFTEAQEQIGTAVGLSGTDATAAAINTRVHDWKAGSDHTALKAAADIGAQAIKVGPKSALAHAFYAEALADSGDTDTSQKELDAATPLASGNYERAEVERERANLAGDKGDKPTALTHFKAASDIQPKWAERTRELAGFYFANGQTDQGVALLKQAVEAAPNDATLRLYLGGIALQQQNVAVAADALSVANRLKPGDPSIESTLAMADFTLHHDVAGAETLLRQAAADAPNDVGIAGLLYGFLRYIKKDDAGAAQVNFGILPSGSFGLISSSGTSYAVHRNLTDQVALQTLNDYRAKAQLPPVKLDNRISAGAESHSYWWLFNLSLTETKALGIHHEVAGTPGYTGVSMRDRAIHFGFPGDVSMAEVIDHEGSPEAAVTVWIDSVYHRFPLMSPLLDSIGFGESFGGGLPMETMDVSFKSDQGTGSEFFPYPAPGQTGVPLAFTGNELPDPVPGGYTSPTGYPITVNFNPYVNVTTPAITLRDASGTNVPFWTLPASPSDENVLTILPKLPLQAKTTYQVHVGASIQGFPINRDWSFTTEGGAPGAVAGAPG